MGSVCPKPNLSHLSPAHQDRMKKIIDRHSNLFSRSKHHLGKFKGFQAITKMDTSSKVNYKQAPRNRMLPKPCKRDLVNYLQSGLFEVSQSGSDKYCANITFTTGRYFAYFPLYLTIYRIGLNNYEFTNPTT